MWAFAAKVESARDSIATTKINWKFERVSPKTKERKMRWKQGMMGIWQVKGEFFLKTVKQ